MRKGLEQAEAIEVVSEIQILPQAQPGTKRALERTRADLIDRRSPSNTSRMRAARTELIKCHDCGGPISFTATTCPECGSLEPGGPYVHNKREVRRFRREARNDHTLLIAVLGCALGGAVYGAVTASGTFAAILFGALYGCLGALIGAPVAFVINMTRHLGR